LPPAAHGAGQLEEGDRAGVDLAGAAPVVGGDPLGGGLERVDPLAKGAPHRGQVVAGGAFQRGERLADRLRDGPGGPALVAGQLAAHQVVGLDARRTLVDRRDKGVAQVLGGAGLLDEAHPAVDLDAGAGDGDAALGGPTLVNGDQKVDQRLVVGASAPGRGTRFVFSFPRSGTFDSRAVASAPLSRRRSSGAAATFLAR
jgi:hypothetical protein